ncbi:MAG: 2'-5' RNA ligase family protein [Bacteroidota bacterium]
MSNKENEALYFLALVPPEPIFSEVERLKYQFFEKYHSKAALKSPPHITLHMPFKLGEHKEQKLISSLSQVHIGAGFNITQKGFGAFAPRVIYINVEPVSELIELQKLVVENLRRNLKIVKDDYKKRGFHPHMTIAFRDLRTSMFKSAWLEFNNKTILYNWEVKSFHLLKHDGQKWGLFNEFPIT